MAYPVLNISSSQYSSKLFERRKYGRSRIDMSYKNVNVQAAIKWRLKIKTDKDETKYFLL